MRSRVLVHTAGLLLAACATVSERPVTTLRTPADRPSLVVEGAPRGAQLFVDGNAIGEAAVYDGQPAVLLVEPGAHVVDVLDESGRVLLRQTVLVHSEAKPIR